jgi:hypothetical protein
MCFKTNPVSLVTAFNGVLQKLPQGFALPKREMEEPLRGSSTA